MSNKLKTLAAVAVLALSSTAVEAQTYAPVGVQNDVSYSDVINGGWSEVYRGDYGTNGVSIADIFNKIAAGSQVMLAAIQDGSTTFDVLAAASVEDVLQVTAKNQTHTANGANWYFNGYSMGFAGLNDVIDQNTADIAGSGNWGYSVERDRLSWHTQGSNASDMTLNGGWRSGSNIWLNSSADWSRVVLVAAPVPEPETYALLLAGLGMVGTMARRRKQAKA